MGTRDTQVTGWRGLGLTLQPSPALANGTVYVVDGDARLLALR
ncbi:PQQ-binding-like beta-propeller repeat protein [Halobium salinum]|uniref:PQQ-binding-like beta-propeller repeat protein n=1 Tax=Halobium salinum TaxID=1364940 RepID=A0ABD5PET9_9EURY